MGHGVWEGPTYRASSWRFALRLQWRAQGRGWLENPHHVHLGVDLARGHGDKDRVTKIRR
jgi:hypothetical protein